MKKVLFTLAMMSVLSACNPSYESADSFLRLPPALQHCDTYQLRDTAAARYLVIHCENSTTHTIRQGKNKKHTIVVDE